MKGIFYFVVLIPILTQGQVLDLEHPQTVYDVAFSETGDLFASAGKDSVVRIWNLEGEKVYESENLDNSISKVLWLKGINLWLASSYGGHVYLFKNNGGIYRDKKVHENAITSIGFIPKRNLLLLGCRGGQLKTLEMGLNIIWEKEIAEKQVHAVAYDPIRDVIATGDSDGEIELWDFEGNRLEGFEYGIPDVWDLVFTQKPQLILARTRKGGTKSFNQAGKTISEFGGVGGMGVMIYQNGLLVNSAGDGYIRYWNIAGKLRDSLKTHDSYVSGLSWSAKGYLATCGGDKKVKVWKWRKDLETECSFFDLMIGEWEVSSKDRISPGNYEESVASSVIESQNQNCEILEKYTGNKEGKKWEVDITTKFTDNGISRIWEDSEHGNPMELEGEFKEDSFFAFWSRDPEDKKMQVKHELKFTWIGRYQFSTHLSTDYGKTWALTHGWKYKKK